MISVSRERFEFVGNKVTIVADYLRHSPLAGYSLAFGLSSGAFLIEWIFDPVLAVAPFLSFFPAIALSALLGGWRAGLFSAVILALLAWYFVIPPRYSFALTSLQDGVLLLFYCLASGLTLLIVILLDLMRAALQASESRFRLATLATNDGVWDHDLATGRVWWNENYNRLFGPRPYASATSQAWWLDKIHPDDRQSVSRAYDAALRGSEDRWTLEYRFIRPDGVEVPVADRAYIARDKNGKPTRILGALMDLTSQKRAEERIVFLMNEVNHRAKNVLGVVSAIALNTARDSDPNSFLERFSERLAALSANYDLVVKNDWRGVDVLDLAASQLSPFKDLFGTRICFHGPKAVLTPAAAQTIGMALHELATNAAKHGALSCASGAVDINWRLLDTEDGQRFLIRWQETGVSIGPPKKKGFGYKVIHTMAAQALEADVFLDYGPSGLIWRLDAPAANTLKIPSIAA